MLHQAVTLTFDPDLIIDGCHCWQLLRCHNNNNNTVTSSYTIDESEKLATRDGFILVAMNADGSNFIPKHVIADTDDNNDCKSDGNQFYFAAPSLEKPSSEILSKPISKNTITLVSSKQIATPPEKSSSNYFTWNVTRFPGGGIAFHTKLEKIERWLKQMQPSSSDSDDKVSPSATTTVTNQTTHYHNDHHLHYLTDSDGRLLSEEKTGGDVVGFGMNLAYPPVVDVSCLLLSSKSNNNCKKSKEAQEEFSSMKKFLIDAAVDCGFFFSVIRYSDDNDVDDEPVGISRVEQERSKNNNSTVLINSASAKQAHEASQRLMKMIQMMFGRSVSAKKRMKKMLSAGNDERNNHQIESLFSSKNTDYFSKCEPLDAQLTKVTLKSTTGEVKTSFNPPRSVKIDLPYWMRNHQNNDEEEDEHDEKKNHQTLSSFVNTNPEEFKKFSSIHHGNNLTTAEIMNEQEASHRYQIETDIATQFHFGEQLASKLVGILLRGVEADMKQWPTPKMIETEPKIYKGIEKTTISEDEHNNDESSVPVNQFYSLFRSVCYPPSSRHHDKKLRKMATTASENDNEKETDENDEEAEYIYEEVEEEVADDDENDNKSSHKSSDTDDSHGKALYEHTDKTWITLLTAHPSLHGLEVVDCDGSTFTECCVPKFHNNSRDYNNNNNSREKKSSSCFTFICNIGDALQMVSRGKYISRTHRARNPKCQNEEKEENESRNDHDGICCCQYCRVSLPLFVEPTPFRWPVSYVVGETENRVL